MNEERSGSLWAGMVAVLSVTLAIGALYLPLLLG